MSVCVSGLSLSKGRADVLQRLNYPLDEELRPGDGLWTRDELERMNASFVVAVEAAFAAGLESRVVAGATVAFRNGNAAAIESAIEGAWDLLCRRAGEVSASEILAFVRERCLNIDQACVRAGLAERLRQRGARW